MATDRFFPKGTRYFAPATPDRPLFQGDIFRGGFGAFWRHPESVRAVLTGAEVPEAPAYPSLDRLLEHVLVRGEGHAMLLPQPCEFADGEKGSTHPFRLVAPIFPLGARAGIDARLVREGRIGHTIWIPRWRDSGPQDFYADLRLMASIDSAFLTKDTRVAALSRAAWMSVADRLSRYFVGIPLDAGAFAVQQGALYPDTAA